MMAEIETGAAAAPAAAARSSLARRIIAFPLTLMLIAIFGFGLASAAGTALIDLYPRQAGSPLLLANAAIAILSLLVAYWLFCRFVERGPMVLFAGPKRARELLAGVAAGAALFALAVGIVTLFGGYHIAGPGALYTMWDPLTDSIVAGFVEELLFRGILFRYLEKTAGSWIALALTSALFGAAHLANPNASLTAAAAIMIEAGILLGAIYMLTRRLWAAIGLHAAWNFTQGWVFGLPVSGTGGGAGMVRGVLAGPDWLTGGAFGLEASLPAVIVATSAGILILVAAVRKGRVVRPLWVSAPAAARPAAPPGTSPS
jgi:membrane protease YdiL (CAAX protease family)